jgi:demethylmenaquinone methyltransferase/2-methoxy-6-polyprenyl-1,4-benzoquinol methylase
VGVDFSTAMLVRAQGKLRARALDGRAALVAGDAERLPLRSGLFDGALVAFGIRNVGGPAAALEELLRVLRPGGRLVVLEFSVPGGLLGRLYRFYFGKVLPRIGGLVSGDRGAYAYLPASVDRFHAPSELGELMRQAGFEAVAWRPLTGGVAHLHVGDKPNGAQAHGKAA